MAIDVNAVGHELQDTLVELIDLSLQAKQAHWNLTGPNFRPIHLQLDDIVSDVRGASDDAAERAAAIGYSPDGRSSTIAKNSPLSDFPEGRIPDTEVVTLIGDRLAVITSRLRERIERLDELDKVSQDLLIGVLAMLDKHHWMVSVQKVT